MELLSLRKVFYSYHTPKTIDDIINSFSKTTSENIPSYPELLTDYENYEMIACVEVAVDSLLELARDLRINSWKQLEFNNTSQLEVIYVEGSTTGIFDLRLAGFQELIDILKTKELLNI